MQGWFEDGYFCHCVLQTCLKSGKEVKDGWIPFHEHRKRSGLGGRDLAEMSQVDRARAYLCLIRYDQVPQSSDFKH